MSSPKKVLVIDCGASHVSAGFFNVSANGVVLQGLEVEPIGSDHSNEIEWVAAVTRGLKEIAGRRRLGGPGRKTYVVAPGHHLLMKFLKIPHVAKSKREQIVRFEAQQNIPYPLPEVVWDYEVILDDGTEFEVALVAVKIEVVQSLCNQLASMGLEPEIVEPSPMAQFNSFHYSYPDDENDASMVINIGAKSSNILFSDRNGFFVRNVAIAGNNVTQAIADDLNLAFHEAEELKLRAFSEEAGLDEEQERSVQLATDSFIRRFTMEATRSVVNFRRQSGREQLSSVYLTGAAALLPGLADHLSEKLKLPVEWYNPLQSVKVGSKVSKDLLDQHSFQLSEMVGAARRAQAGCRTHFNLLPPVLAAQQAFNRKKTNLVAAAAVFVVAAFLPIYHYHTTAETYEQQAELLTEDLQPLRDFDRRIQENLNQADQVRNQVQTVRRIVNSKDNWLVFLNDLQNRLMEVEDVWLDQMTFAGAARPQQQPAGGGGGGLFDRGAQQQQQEAAGSNGMRLNVSGRLIDRDNPLSPVSQQSRERVESLLERFTESAFIASVENERFDPSQPGILRFDFVLVLDESNPL